MKILILTPQFYPERGAISYLTESLAIKLKEKGHLVKVVHLSAQRESLSSYYIFNNVPVERFYYPEKFDKNKSYIEKIIYKLKKYLAFFKLKNGMFNVIKNFQPDVINLHYSTSFNFLMNSFSKKLKKRTITTFHGGAGWSELYKIPKKKNLNNKEQNFIKCLKESYIAIAVSKWLKNELNKISNLENIRAVHNGIHLISYEEKVYFNISRYTYIFAIGRFENDKGFDLLIRAFAEIQIDYPEYHLILGGSGSLKSFYEELVKKLNIEGKVHFPGYLDGVEKSAYLKSADLIVVPSRVDALNIVALEAIASGNTVVATNVGGVPEAGGNLVHYADPTVESINEKMIEAINAEPPSKKAIEVHLSKFTVDKMVNKYEEVFYEALNGK